MDDIFDFSAAPHLPYSLRSKRDEPLRPDLALSTIFNAIEASNIAVLARDGEIYVEACEPMPPPSVPGDQIEPFVLG